MKIKLKKDDLLNNIIYILFVILYFFVLLNYGMGSDIGKLRYFVSLIAVFSLLLSYLLSIKAKKRIIAVNNIKLFLLFIPLSLIFIILSYFISSNLQIEFSDRVLVQTILVLVPPIFAYFFINAMNFKSIEFLLKFTLIATIFAYFCEDKHGIVDFLTLSNWKNISFGRCFIESDICAGVFLELFIFFHYMKYNKVKINNLKLYYVISFLFTVLSFKRFSILFAVFIIIISKKVNLNKKVSFKVHILLAVIFSILTQFYFNFMKGEYCSVQTVYDLTSGRNYLLMLWENENFFSYGFGTSMLVIGRYLEMDLIQIYVELGFIPLLLFCLCYFISSKKNVYSLLLILFVFINLLTASSLPSILSNILLFINLGIIISENYKKEVD